MEKYSKRKSQSQYLSLIVKKTIQDRLSIKEMEAYRLLKANLDPLGKLEDELIHAWKVAEGQRIEDMIYPAVTNKTKKNIPIINFLKKSFLLVP